MLYIIFSASLKKYGNNLIIGDDLMLLFRPVGKVELELIEKTSFTSRGLLCPFRRRRII
ncbi:hypothetical protein DOT_0186 [Desulfosporosinus sp. OT]|nr:hypothetical protein DOT_0186 [Desulfosporosinus sp. OT]